MEGEGVERRSLLTLLLEGSESSASLPGRALPLGEGPPVLTVCRGRGGLLDAEAKGKILSL
jgi:hypothetical protein